MPGFQTLVERGIVWSVDEARRRAWQQLEMPGVTYVDGFNVPNYENRPDPAEVPAAVHRRTRRRSSCRRRPSSRSSSSPASPTSSSRSRSRSTSAAGSGSSRRWTIRTRCSNGNPGDDRIKILEDTNGDGRADKFTVFAEHLNLPTSLTFANGGVIVAAAPHFLFLKDTNGDDKADVRQVLNTGWGIRDTHAGPSNLQYAPDNHIWGVVGYSGFDGQMNGKPMQFTQGAVPLQAGWQRVRVPDDVDEQHVGARLLRNVRRVRVDREQRSELVHGDSRTGISPTSRGCRAPAAAGAPSGRAAIRARRRSTPVHPTTPYIRQVDVWGGYTAAAGHYLYTARAFPKEYWNRIAFINEPTAHLIGQAVLEKQGAGFVARDGWNLISSAEEWFAPVAAMVGPDGAVWFADWYNFIAQHNPTPAGFSVGKGAAYETSMRDHLRGRIYRIVYQGRARRRRSDRCRRAIPRACSSALAADNMFWRLHAQRLLVERGQKDVVPQLVALARNQSVDADRHQRRRVPCAVDAAGTRRARTPTTSEAYRAAVDALKHPAAGVRKAAAMVLPHTAEAGRAILSAGLLHDPDLHTRLAAVLAIADMPTSAEIGQALYAESQKADELQRQVAEPRVLHRRQPSSEELHGRVSRRSATRCRTARCRCRCGLGTTKPDWRTPAAQELAERLGRHAGSRQLGVARPARLRRRRVVHAHVRLERRRRADDAVARPASQHR